MPITADPNSIGIGYQIDLAKLADSIRNAKKLLESFHKDFESLAKKANVIVTIKDQQARAKVKKFASAMQAELDKSGILKLKAVPESFGKIGGLTPRLTEDYKKLYDMFGRSPELLGKVNSSFKRVNNSIAEQAVRMQSAGRNGIGFYETANRVSLVQQDLNGTLKATSTGFRNIALETKRASEAALKASADKERERFQRQQDLDMAKKLETAQKGVTAASLSSTRQLRQLGISSTTTAADIKKMNLSTLDMQRAFELTKTRMRELSKEMVGSGRSSATAAREFKMLQSRMPFLEHEANKGIKAFGDYRRAMDRWGGGFKYMMLSQAAWIASGAVLFGALTAVGGAIKDFVDFHQDLRDAAAIVQATTTGYEKMEAAAVKAFQNSTMSLKDTTNALKILGQTGMEASESAIALETVYKITTATGGDMTTVVKFLTTALNVWNLEAQDAAKVGNILGAALNYSKLEVEDLGTTFNYVASLAKSVGLSIVDLAATMAVMSNAGIKASTIGTGLRGVFSKLLDITPKFEKELAKVGLSVDDVNIRTQGFFKVLKNLETAGFDIGNIFKGLTRREAAALNVLLEQGTDRLNTMRQALTDTEAAEVLFQKSMQGMKNQIILAGHSIQQYMINRLSFLGSAITGTAKFINELFKSLDQLNGIILIVAGSWATYKIVQLLVATATDTMIAALFRLRGAMVFFTKSHPFFVAVSALILGYTILKRVIDATTDSLEKKQARISRTMDDIRKLEVVLKDNSKTEKERRETFLEMAKDYPQLLDFLQTHRQSIDDLTEATKKFNEVQKKAQTEIDRTNLARSQASLQRLQDMKKEAEEAQRAGTDLRNKSVGPVGSFFGGWKDPKDAIKEIDSQINRLEPEIEQLKKRLGILFAGKVPEDKTTTKEFQWLPEMEKALEKLRLKTGSEREKIRKELIKGLEDFGMTEEIKTNFTEKQLEARKLLFNKYWAELQKIEDKEFNAHNRAIEKIKRRVDAQIAAVIRVGDKERGILDNLNKFKEALSDDETKLIKNDYIRRGELLDKEIGERNRKYDKMLADAKSYYDKVQLLAEKNPLLRPELENINDLIAMIENLKNRLDKISGSERARYQQEAPSNIAGGFREGFREARETLSNEYELWKSLSQGTAIGMRDAFSDLFFDSMRRELKLLSDYWTLFADSVKRKIADIASSWVTSGIFGKTGGSGGLLGWIGSTVGLGSLFSHEGGPIKKMHSGGFNLKKGDESLRILKENEFVIKDSSAKSLGESGLNYANKTGRWPENRSNVNVNHSYTIYAMDAESIDQALRRGGARAIQEISIGAYEYEKGTRRNPSFIYR